MDPLGIVRRLSPESVKRLAKQTGLAAVFDRLYNSSVYAGLRVRSSAQEVTFETPAGRVTMSLPETYSGIITEKLSQPGGYEPGLVADLAAHLGPEDVLYDCGAGFGYNGAVARACGVQESNLYLIEADPYRVRYCEWNHPGATCIHATVGDGSGETEPLDSLVTTGRPPTVLTIDIEGNELSALFGVSGTLWRYKPRLYVEMHPGPLSGTGPGEEDVFEYLRSFDYTLAVTNHRDPDSTWTDDLSNPPTSTAGGAPTYLLRAE